MNSFRRYLLLNVLRAPDDGGAGAGAGAGAGGAGAGTGAGGAGAGAGAGAGGAGSGAGAGGAGAGGAGAGGDGGKANEPFYSSYGLDQADVDYLAGKNFSDGKTLVQSLKHFEKLARDKNVITKPDPTDPKFAEHEVHELLGWVKDPAKYELKKPELKEGIEYSGELFDKLKGILHDGRVPLGTAQKIHDGLWNFFMEKADALKAGGAKSLKDLDTALRSEWKGDYDVKSALARRAYETFAPNADDQAMLNRIMGDPRAVKMWANIGEKIGEAHLPGAGGGGNSALTPNNARAERMRLENDKAWMAIFNDQRHPQYEDYRAHRDRLLEAEAKASR